MNAKLKNFAITDADAPLLPMLSPAHRAVLSATGSYAEIATALTIAEGTVKSRIHRAKLALIALRPQNPEVAAA